VPWLEKGEGGGGRRNESVQQQTTGALTLAIVAKGHLGLAEANGVLSGADAIELLELGLLNVLQWVNCLEVSDVGASSEGQEIEGLRGTKKKGRPKSGTSSERPAGGGS
jgi:hypothetical protein